MRYQCCVTEQMKNANSYVPAASHDLPAIFTITCMNAHTRVRATSQRTLGRVEDHNEGSTI